MGTGLLQRLTSVAAWGALCALFSLFASTGAIILAALILAIHPNTLRSRMKKLGIERYVSLA